MPDSAPQGVHARELDASPEETLHSVALAAEAWGSQWHAGDVHAGDALNGKLILPVSAGVRRGWIGYLVSAAPLDPSANRTRLELRPAEEHLIVDRATVVFLLTALAGALLFLVVPFVPRLMPLLPMGFVLTAAGWLVVAARLRNSGVEQFLDSLDGTDHDSGDDSGDDSREDASGGTTG